MTDWELIRQYRDDSSHAAFAEIVERHMKLVYWTCRRELACDALAEDATQAVFILLACKANSLKQGTSVSGWLFHTARFVARTLQRSEQRRQRHEKEAAFVNDVRSRHEDEWLSIEPRLNEALAALPSADRDVLLLRFFDGLSLREVAHEIGTTEDTARKRVSRALERMRRSLFRKKAAITSLALGALLGSHLAKAVPLATHKATLESLPSWLSSSASPLPQALLLKQGAYFIMQATKQKVIVASIAVFLLGAVITLPIAGWKIYHQRAVAAAVGQGGFTDQTAEQAGADPAHNEIAGQIRQVVDLYNTRNLSQWSQIILPNAPVINPNGTLGGNGARVVALNQRTLSMHSNAKLYATLKSLRIQGDQAVAVADVEQRETTVAGDPSPAGQLATMNEEDEMDWKKMGGKWVIVQFKLRGHVQRGE